MIRYVERRELTAADIAEAETMGMTFELPVGAAAFRAFGLQGRPAVLAFRITAVPLGAGPVSRRPLLWRMITLSEEILDLVGDAPDGLSPLMLLGAVSWQELDPGDDVGRYELLYAAVAVLDGEGLALLQHRSTTSWVVLTDAGHELHQRDRAGAPPPSTRPGKVGT